MIELIRQKASEETVSFVTVMERLLEATSCTEMEEIVMINPDLGEPKILLRRMIEVGQSGGFILEALRRAVENVEMNQVEMEDLNWFIVATIVVAEEVENQSTPREYDHLLELVKKDEVRMRLAARLKNGEYSDPEHFSPWLSDLETVGVRASKLALIFSGKLEEAMKPFPAKVISWRAMANIANALTNQLDYVSGVNPQLAHVSFYSIGGRAVDLEEGRKGELIDEWTSFQEEDVRRLYFRSNSSGNVLEAKKLAPNNWSLVFVVSEEKPLYRGSYFHLYENPEAIKPLEFKPSFE